MMFSTDNTGDSAMLDRVPAFGTIAYDDVVRFHGHSCPGLAYGWRMTVTALAALRIRERARDEELVAIVENDACGVDALQYLTGCTFGKGNLIFRDWGKMAFTLIRRDMGAAVRVRVKTGGPVREMAREEQTRWILTGPEEEIVDCEAVTPIIPDAAAGMPSVICVRCGERTMETRTVTSEKGPLCRPCAIECMPGILLEKRMKPEQIIRILDMKPLAGEGGLFAEVYRSEKTIAVGGCPDGESGSRNLMTSIYYILTPGQISRMHRVASDEIFHLLAGGPVRMVRLDERSGSGDSVVLGLDMDAGERPMVVVRAGTWQGMELLPGAAFALFGCTVAPGFDPADFELGCRDSLIAGWPSFACIIDRLMRAC
ncbi:cupin domain-containing protein [bacterium]|nr:cupin domain-containing protein [candidate division CSSED10-310 bacterium]